MARNHGRVSVAIWDDADFIALPAGQQRMYMFLLAQRNLNHAGLLPLTMKRWAGKYAGGSEAQVRADLQGLARARFVMVDGDAEEVLIRTLVKNDDIYRQPQIMKRLVEDAQEITSPRLRRALLDELERLPLHELSDEPPGTRAKDPRSVRRIAADSINAIRNAFGAVPANPSPDPSEGVPATLADTLPEGCTEGLGEPSPQGFAMASSRTRTRPAPTPSPLPPIPPTAGNAKNGVAASEPTEPDTPTAQTLVAEWIDSCPQEPPRQVIGQVAKHVGAMLAQRFPVADVRAGLTAWQDRRLNPSALPSIVHELRSGPAPARTLPGRGRPGNPYLDDLRAQFGDNVIAMPAIEAGAS